MSLCYSSRLGTFHQTFSGAAVLTKHLGLGRSVTIIWPHVICNDCMGLLVIAFGFEFDLSRTRTYTLARHD